MFEPWRQTFYPDKLPKTQELFHASRQLSAIEINSTYYSTQKPATIAKWRDETPADFMFSLKASRFSTNRRVLADAKESVDRFVQSGITELGPKLGPIVWQFMPTKVFDADDFGAFLELLPAQVDGHKLRHVVDVRHASFMAPDYLALARRFKVATVFSDTDDYPSFADLTGDFVYARLMRTHSDQPTGYASAALAKWAKHAKAWQAGEAPAGLPQVADAPAASTPRDVFLFFISGAKERAPAAAMALLKRLGFSPGLPA